VIEQGISRAALQTLLAPGGARNAIDCALWDLEAKRTGRPAWQTAGLGPPKPVCTAYTLSADAPELMAARALSSPEARVLKLKLTGDPVDVDRVRTVALARPDAMAVGDNQRR
jgi:L-alanine-DL-glutamate epimerase-like enolase superfamily enzyme